MEYLVSELKENYDYVLFDFPSLNIVSDADILIPFADRIILVAALQDTTKRQLQDAKSKMKEYKEKYMGLIVNKVDISQYRTYIKDYDYFKGKNMQRQYSKKMKEIKDNTKGANA